MLAVWALGGCRVWRWKVQGLMSLKKRVNQWGQDLIKGELYVCSANLGTQSLDGICLLAIMGKWTWVRR